MIRFCCILALVIWHAAAMCQSKIHYIESISLDNAISLARSQKKLIFIETYADWCIPCKKMEQELNQSEISSFFNENYINVKIDVDNSPFAQAFKSKFDIVFLPTLLLLDVYGNIKYSTDKLMAGKDFLYYAKEALKENVYFGSDATPVSTNPMSGQSGSRGDLSDVNKLPDRIVYTSGAGQNIPAEVLYKEAYFRIELMDGSHKAVAERYLETQKDWSTATNMKFILDFTESASQRSFSYLRDHHDEFIEMFGRERVMATGGFLADERLTQGYPRPEYEECIILMKMKQVQNPTLAATQYHLLRLEMDCKWEAYWDFADLQLLNNNISPTHQLMYNLANNGPNEDPISLKKRKEYIEKAIALQPMQALYFECQYDILMKIGDTKAAKRALDQAIKLSPSPTQSYYASHLQKKKKA